MKMYIYAVYVLLYVKYQVFICFSVEFWWFEYLFCIKVVYKYKYAVLWEYVLLNI